MANLRDIRRRIKSVKNTAQITRAMQLVAAAKMKKAQDQALAGREYEAKINGVLGNLKENTDEAAHPLLEVREKKKTLMLVISTDKGLCGGLNTNLSKKLLAEKDAANTDYVTVGRKLRMQLEKFGKEVKADFVIEDPVPFAKARSVAKLLSDTFLSGDYDVIKVAYTNFVSTLTQDAEITQLLPISSDELANQRRYGYISDVKAARAEAESEQKQVAPVLDYEFEPSPEAVLNSLLPQYINFQVYQLLLESRASEHSARMVAMKAATDNAKKMIDELTLDYNKLRQAAITAELLEITTAMKAME